MGLPQGVRPLDPNGPALLPNDTLNLLPDGRQLQFGTFFVGPGTRRRTSPAKARRTWILKSGRNDNSDGSGHVSLLSQLTNRSDGPTESRPSRGKESRAIALLFARVALLQVRIFPIRNRTSGEGPDFFWKNAAL